jgi:hypothetical protein
MTEKTYIPRPDPNLRATVFAVKERVLRHNPMAALYLASSYYTRLHDKE